MKTFVIFFIGLLIGSASMFVFMDIQARNINRPLVEKLIEVRASYPIVETPIIGGIVTQVGGDYIIINSQPSSSPFEDWPLIRRIEISDKTRIFKTIPREDDRFREEMIQYQEKLMRLNSIPLSEREEDAVYPNPPSPVEEVVLQLNQVEIGKYASVLADRDIRLEEVISPISIEIKDVEENKFIQTND